ncbi:MAG: hypothetical protein KKE05_00875, partial [Nanoarchaeota archaeon]|nr:hypothetical protein [Nanoarchaeota archaeon]
MRKTLFLGLFALMMFAAVASAEMQEVNFTLSSGPDNTGLSVVQLRYDPYPVNPGEYFDFYVKAQQGIGSAPDATFVLDPRFPFSLDSNENPKRELGKLFGDPVVLHYKVRVSDDAVEGTNVLTLRYSPDGSSTLWYVRDFDIQVAEAQTDFDLVVQDSTGSEVSLAIANTGKNPANSLIVRIPSQDGFVVTGATGQMVGNLDSGDYSIVSFSLSQVGRGSGFLTVEMDYTDNIGVRRTVEKQVRYNFGSASAGNYTNFSGGFRRTGTQSQSSSSSSNTWVWVVIIAVVVVGYVIYRRKKR